ncbi:CRISPR system CMR subunit Cmr7A [Saccharolobus solfataricus]|uniref:CRISPR system CMR subunit Cmr7 1 n=3 Tax=Saccharolobus solfataricus TaxID=2287 RepID=CMR7A_SACS2|nr:CRISPR system CMR subunit Cmr7A [Saccharolobus solfataricus]Q97WX5.1 RecName: Full=CRISPR system CMR subunit Cmr7 1 [Saccharolobus solfataricus P2]AAK42176.1 Hypothetical protein SSO1986 [Saccharolobus solfataricus P2]QPG49254.1 CRISPR system CMR subunit Cmr7A [Saccharolobus solfataricus]SAI85673.1 CRISPR-associated protein Cmr7 [Saccharolobus solfataricus]
MTSGAGWEEQVFLPITNSISSEDNNQIKIGSSVSIEYNQNGQHVSQIDDKGLHNILVLTGYAIDESTGELVPTFDPCDYVKGILISGKILKGNHFKIIGIPSNKLYIIRKKDVHGNITFSLPIKNFNTGTYQVDLRDKVTSFVSLDRDVAKTIVDNVLAKIYAKIYNSLNKEQKDKLYRDVEEIFNYYSIKSLKSNP